MSSVHNLYNCNLNNAYITEISYIKNLFEIKFSKNINSEYRKNMDKFVADNESDSKIWSKNLIYGGETNISNKDMNVISYRNI